jgi:hypothetical protein
VESRRKLWLGWTGAIAAVAVTGYLFSGLASAALDAGVGLLLAPFYLAAYIVLVIAIPLALFTLIRFVYSLWIKTWLRAWRINRIRNARDLREAIDRGKAGG